MCHLVQKIGIDGVIVKKRNAVLKCLPACAQLRQFVPRFGELVLTAPPSYQPTFSEQEVVPKITADCTADHRRDQQMCIAADAATQFHETERITCGVAWSRKIIRTYE